MNETKKRGNANLPALILLAVLLMFWQAAAMGIDAAYILPSPTQILVRLWELRGPLFTAHLPATMSVVAIGLSISIVLGLGLAVLMDISEIAEKALYPLIIASQTIPTTALAPLFVLWFGYCIWSKVLVTVLITFFPITITVFDGFKSVKTEMEELLFNLSFDIVKCIQEERYDDLEMQGCLKKTSKEYLKNVLDDYGGVLDIVQKEEYLKSFQYIKINNQDIFKTYLDLMIDGERSDLTIICEIETDDCGNVKIAIEDLHVL